MLLKKNIPVLLCWIDFTCNSAVHLNFKTRNRSDFNYSNVDMSKFCVYFPHFHCTLFVIVFRVCVYAAACAIILGLFSMEMILNFIQFNMVGIQTAYISACDDVIYKFFVGYSLCFCFHSFSH